MKRVLTYKIINGYTKLDRFYCTRTDTKTSFIFDLTEHQLQYIERCIEMGTTYSPHEVIIESMMDEMWTIIMPDVDEIQMSSKSMYTLNKNILSFDLIYYSTKRNNFCIYKIIDNKIHAHII